MKPKMFATILAAMAAAGCVYHHEVQTSPDRDRMELAMTAGAGDATMAQADSGGD